MVGRELLNRAVEIAPEEEEIQANVAYLVSLEEGNEAGLAYLDSLASLLPDSHSLLNQRANLLTASGSFDEAVRYYEKSPAARSVEPGLSSQLRCRLPQGRHDQPRRRALSGAAGRKRRSRRDDGYRQLCLGQERVYAGRNSLPGGPWCCAPLHPDAHANLVELLRTRRQLPEALSALAAAEEAFDELPSRISEVKRRLEEDAYDSFRCAGCDRLWREPKSSAPVPPARIHGEPPGHAPAGRCEECGRVYCVACASQRPAEGGRLVCECGGPLKLNEAPAAPHTPQGDRGRNRATLTNNGT